MNPMKKNLLLPAIALSGGGLGLALRYWLLHTGRDDRGLLNPGHPALWLLTLVTVGVLTALFVCTKNPGGPGKYYDNFPKSLAGGICAFGAAAALFLNVMGLLMDHPDTLTAICAFAGLASVFALGFTGYCRMQKRRPSFLFHTVLCLYLMLRLLCRYQSWSGDPQPASYAWELVGTVCLMLAAYHRAEFDLNLGNRRRMQFFGLAGVFFSIVCLADPNGKLFFAAMGAWLLTNLCTLTPLPEENPDTPT